MHWRKRSSVRPGLSLPSKAGNREIAHIQPTSQLLAPSNAPFNPKLRLPHGGPRRAAAIGHEGPMIRTPTARPLLSCCSDRGPLPSLFPHPWPYSADTNSAIALSPRYTEAPAVAAALNASGGRGRPLPPTLRRFLLRAQRLPPDKASFSPSAFAPAPQSFPPKEPARACTWRRSLLACLETPRPPAEGASVSPT